MKREFFGKAISRYGTGAGEKAKWLGLKLLPVLIGFALARTGILGRTGVMKGIYPFGASFAAAVPSGSAAAAVAGILLGFILPGNDAETLRCAASALAAAGIKWALAELKTVKSSPFFAPAAAFAGVVITGVVVTTSIGADVSYDLAAYFAEGAMAAAGAYFFVSGLDCWKNRNSRSLTAQDIYCLTASLCVISIPLCRLEIFGLSPVSTMLMTVLLAVSARFGAAGGGSAGIALGTVLALAEGRFALLGIMAVAGLAAALFSPVGKIAASAAFSVCCVLGVLASGEVDIYILIEAVTAAVMYSVIRGDRLSFLFAMLEPEKSGRVTAAAGSYVSQRLLEAAHGLEDASRTVSEVSLMLDRLDAPKANMVCRRATGKVCADCAISGFCWGTSREQTQQLFDSLSDILRRDGRLDRMNTPEQLRSRCARWGEMAEQINAGYAEYTADSGASRRIAQIRQAVAGQLSGCGQLLSELAEENDRKEKDCRQLSRTASELLHEYGVAAEDVSCVRRQNGSVVINMTLRQSEDYPEPEYDSISILSDGLNMDFARPQTVRAGDSLAVTAESLPVYSLSVGMAQHSKGGGRLCGDVCDIINGVNGGTVVLLSDGMGTGGRAAVDAALVCDLMRRLLSAGFGEKGALELVNSAMQASSGEETLATVDCARVDVYTGRMTLTKAGAVSTYIIGKNGVRTAEAESLPLGIMSRPDSCSVEIQLECGDVVVMTSDGAVSQGSEWIIEELDRISTDNAQQLARDLLSLAAARCSATGDDDITVLVFRLDDYTETETGSDAA